MANELSGVVCASIAGLLLGCAAALPPVTESAGPSHVAPPVTRVEKRESAESAAQLTAAQTEPEGPAAAVTTRVIPTSCADPAECFPPPAFVDAVCKKKFPDLPLTMFAGRAPWLHQYVKAEYVEPVNPYGGERSEAWMKFGEEVVVLRRRGPGEGKGVQISGPTDVDVLRWDGTCATIRQEMLVSYVPAPMQTPRVVWRYLHGDLQQALLANGIVARAREAERKACRDSSAKHPTNVCDKAMQKLTDAIALAVHQNVALPSSGNAPEWVASTAQ